MPIIERYILRRSGQAFLLTLGGLAGPIWVTQLLRELDVVTSKGQAIWVYLLITVLALPALVQVVAPIALLVSVIVTLNGLNSDSELPVISSAGASQRAVNRPILLLAVATMAAVTLSHHVIAPASLSALRGVITRVRADVIATLIQDGGFRSVDDGLTVHIREKAADGTFHDIFVSDDRDPNESVQYSAAQGMLLERGSESFLVLQNGHLIQASGARDENNVVEFETYALDLSQLGTPNAAAFYKAKERSTFYLLEPEPGDPFSESYPERVAAEIHHRTTAPLYSLAFAFVAIAFLGRPRTNRQDRSFAVTAVVLVCLALRIAGFGAVAAAGGTRAAIPFMYLIPLAGIAFGAYATMRDLRLRIPRVVEASWDAATKASVGVVARIAPMLDATRTDRL
ncbi:MAG TPA: LPS export ABC transporter permease LptF [Propylenella sp.]|nr:LPS export ABC transporter permease LptF [Propylenella sp.]